MKVKFGWKIDTYKFDEPVWLICSFGVRLLFDAVAIVSAKLII